MRGWGTEIHSRNAGSGIQSETCSERVGDGVWDIRSPGMCCEVVLNFGHLQEKMWRGG